MTQIHSFPENIYIFYFVNLFFLLELYCFCPLFPIVIIILTTTSNTITTFTTPTIVLIISPYRTDVVWQIKQMDRCDF